MNQLSAVIITKNEEANIDRCLESLVGVVDETIVVDSFSTDQTEEICAKYGVRFEQRAFKDYSDQKNYANGLAQFDFILSIDADEALSEALKQSILTEKQNGLKDGYEVNRLTNYCGQWIRHGGWYPEHKLRIWKKSTAKWVLPIHERVEFIGKEKHLLTGDLLHYSYPTIASHMAQINKFTDLKAKEQFEAGINASRLQLWVKPKFEFFKKYILKQGFRDGYYGLVIARLSAHYKFCQYAKTRDLFLQSEKKK